MDDVIQWLDGLGIPDHGDPSGVCAAACEIPHAPGCDAGTGSVDSPPDRARPAACVPVSARELKAVAADGGQPLDMYDLYKSDIVGPLAAVRVQLVARRHHGTMASGLVRHA